MAKRGPRRQSAPLQQELSGAPFDHVVFDVIGPLPTTVRDQLAYRIMGD